MNKSPNFWHCTEVRFTSFLSGGFTTLAVINPPERKLAKRTSVHCLLLSVKTLGDFFQNFVVSSEYLNFKGKYPLVQ